MAHGATDRLWVLTGAPGTGKTAILERLGDVLRVPEPAREVIAEQRRTGGRATSDQDPEAFVRLLLERAISQYKATLELGRAAVFDRGIPDCIAYAAVYGFDTGPALAAGSEYRYNRSVLVLRPWMEIFSNDEERTLTFAMAERFQGLIESAYTAAGYQLVEVSRGSIAERAEFVAARIGAER